MKVSCVLFDMDGTLVDSLNVYEMGFRDIFRRLRIPPLKSGIMGELIRNNINPWEYMQRKLGFSKTLIAEAQRIDKEIFSHYYAEYAIIYREALSLLEELRERSVQLAIVTSSWFDDTVSRALIPLTGKVDVVVSRDDAKRQKPHPDLLLVACKRLSAEARAAVYVGTPKWI